MNKHVLLLALVAVIGVSAHASVPTSPVMSARVHMSARVQTMGNVRAISVVKGVTLLSNSDADLIRGKGFFGDFFDFFEDAYKWIKNHISFTYTYNNDGSSNVTAGPSGGGGGRVNKYAY